MYVKTCHNFWRQKCDKERSWEDPAILRPYNRNTAHVECTNKSDTSNNRGNWNHFKIIQKVPEQHRGKAQNKGTTPQKKATLFTAHIPWKVLMYMYKTFNMKNNISCSINCQYRIDEKIYPRHTVFVRYIIVNTLHKGDNEYHHHHHHYHHVPEGLGVFPLPWC